MGALSQGACGPAWLPRWLEEGDEFPDPRMADREGLVAVGGDLSVARLQDAYRIGVFPWSVDPVSWWSPDPRAILELEGLHIPRSLDRVLRRNAFTSTIDSAFGSVIRACAAPAPGRSGTWITLEFIQAYQAFHEAGHAHSLEVWSGTDLVGGIYGVARGGLFAGESMFHQVPNASKVALVRLVQHLRERGFALFDIQMLTPVTRQLGGTEIPRDEYLRRLADALSLPCSFK